MHTYYISTDNKGGICTYKHQHINWCICLSSATCRNKLAPNVSSQTQQIYISFSWEVQHRTSGLSPSFNSSIWNTQIPKLSLQERRKMKEVHRDLSSEMTCMSSLHSPLVRTDPTGISWPQPNCRGDWETEASALRFSEHYLPPPYLASMFWEFPKHQLMSVCDLGGYHYLSLPDEENKIREVKQLA